jgi:hypothetical protein
MSLFLLPKALCNEINSLMRNFWWGQQGKEGGIKWMKWEHMSNSKASGGMGFRDFACFNKALFAKQSWRLWNNPASLVARLMKAKYYSETSILEAKIGQRPSFVWRSILSSCDLLREGLVWRVGNGSNIRIWKDKWLPNTDNPRIISPLCY